MRIKRIGIVSLGKISGILYGFFGLIAGIILSIVALIGSIIGSSIAESPEPLVGIFLGAGAIVALPLFYGIMGFLIGLLTAAIYNLIARIVGGLEIELEETATQH